MQKKVVGMTGVDPSNKHQFLFATLADLYPIEFRQISPADHPGLDGLIVLDGDQAKGIAAAAEGLPCFVAGPQEPEGPRATRSGAPGTVRFGASEMLDECLRKQEMRYTG